MATQNIAVPTGETQSFLESLATEVFENHGAEIGDAAINKNFALAWLREHAEKVEVGGLDFVEPVRINENSNFGHRSHYSDIPDNVQTPNNALRFDQVTLSGSIVLNKKHELMAKGKHEIRSIMKDLREQADSTISNTLNTAMWDSSPTANIEPESIRSIVPDDPTTGTLGGANRATATWARSRVSSTAISDIGSEAGITALHTFRIMMRGGAKSSPDFALTTATLYASLFGFMDANRRVMSNEKMTKLGFDNFMIGSATLGHDGDGGTGECPASHFYWLNSKHLFFKVLEGSLFKFEPFRMRGKNLNSSSIFYMFYNLTTNLPGSMGVHTNVS